MKKEDIGRVRTCALHAEKVETQDKYFARSDLARLYKGNASTRNAFLSNECTGCQ